MNFLTQWIQSDWLKALGWTFVHSLWQIAIIGLLLYIVLRLIPGRSAHMRYTISTLAIWSIVIMSLSTFIIMLPDAKQISHATGSIILMESNGALSVSDRISIWLESRMPMMLTIWLGGVIILMVRLLLSLGWVGHMRSASMPSVELQTSLDNILNRLNLKVSPAVSESNYVSSPVTIGHLKPLILFPIGIINQLTPAEVEAVLTHELAHIVRRDYLSNLIQSFIETLFYYHPVIWWISGVVRTERENRADDLAISWCGDHLGYAKALMTVQEMQSSHKPSLAIGFASRKGAMLARIQRILHIPYKNHNQMEKTVLLSLCSLCFLAFTLTGDAKKDEQNKKENTALVEAVRIEQTTDSIPATGTYRIHKKTDEQEINVEVENGTIKELKIDGKEIEPAQYGQYDEIIGELFGETTTAPSAKGFYFEMPHMPHVTPGAPMPPMPPIPPMEAIEIERFMEKNHHFFQEAPHIGMFNGEEMDFKIFYDSLGNGTSKIIIINAQGDSNVILRGNGMDLRKYMPAIEVEKYMLDAEEWQKHSEEWQKMSKEWKQDWKEHSGEWKENMKAHQMEMEQLQKELQKEGFKMREGAILEEHLFDENKLMELESLRGEMDGLHVYGLRSPRLNMTDAMIKDGLIDRGEEAEIVLTPDKLKINGKKMDDETHEKYLRMYEAQQGVELSGNSRIEFKTKSRRSM